MSMSDPIADMLTRVRNALAARKRSVTMPLSKTKLALAEALKAEGYISDVATASTDGKSEMTITLRYAEGMSAIERIERVSRPGRRVYCGVADMPSVNGGLGVVMLSTSKGLMTDRQARSAGVGGEILCRVF
ncbi:MAG: 30S ribosomal protein S8 [Arenicellales bacterium]|jgi:small subunit ribosomal protein S8|nr:30S ribosomal protein S8 [Gammaproteobacteria bacterium]NDA14459.1 30S ribosomal protein S8 [Gammaproteobacteria bacterium]NDG43876.1 30S ribosomal protein S8 [Gammaproteobacteria bacterium]